MRRALILIAVVAVVAAILVILYMQGVLYGPSGPACPSFEQGLMLEYECSYTINLVHTRIRGTGSLTLNVTSEDVAELCLSLEPPANESFTGILVGLLSGCRFIDLEKEGVLEDCESSGRTTVLLNGVEHEVEVYKCSDEGTTTRIYVDRCEVPLKVEMLANIGGGSLLLSCMLSEYPSKLDKSTSS